MILPCSLGFCLKSISALHVMCIVVAGHQIAKLSCTGKRHHGAWAVHQLQLQSSNTAQLV